jgi:hypothetical protein
VRTRIVKAHDLVALRDLFKRPAGFTRQRRLGAEEQLHPRAKGHPRDPRIQGCLGRHSNVDQNPPPSVPWTLTEVSPDPGIYETAGPCHLTPRGSGLSSTEPPGRNCPARAAESGHGSFPPRPRWGCIPGAAISTALRDRWSI